MTLGESNVCFQRVKALLEIRKVELVLEDTTRDHSVGIKGLIICSFLTSNQYLP